MNRGRKFKMERIPEAEAIEETQNVRQFNEVMGRKIIQREYQNLARELISLGLPDRAKVLDVGTGTGYVAIAIAKQLKNTHKTVTGLDLSETMLTVAAENAANAGVSDMITWQRGDAKAMPFNDAEFDAVVSSGSLHHWTLPEQIFNEIARVLKPNGYCIIRDSQRVQTWHSRLIAWAISMFVPGNFRKHYWGSIHASYTPAELRQILDRTRLKDADILEDMVDLMIIIGQSHTQQIEVKLFSQP